jgi:hypothetical protein
VTDHPGFRLPDAFRGRLLNENGVLAMRRAQAQQMPPKGDG